MKRLFVSAAVASMMLVGCQNDDLVVNSVPSGGELFELSVGQEVGSRTSLGNSMETLWNPGDKLYVTSEDGTVSGVLTFQGDENSNSGLFSGYVFGGNVTALRHVIFPVPENGAIELKQPTAGKLDLPMFGELNANGGTVSATLNNVCALINLPVVGDGAGDGKVSLSEKDGLLTGNYVYRRGQFEFVPDPEGAVTVSVDNGKAFIAVSTTNGKGEDINEIALVVEGNTEAPVSIPVKAGYVSENNVPEIEVGENGEVATKTLVRTPEELADAFAKGGDYKLDETFEGIVTQTLTVPEDVKLSLDLNNVELTLNSGRGIDNHGNLTITNGHIVFESTLNDIAVVGIYNEKKLTLVNVNVTSNGYCVYSKGEPWSPAPLAEQGKATVTVDITKGEFTSDVAGEEHKTEGKHVYAIYTIYNSTLTMNGATVSGHGGIGVDVSYGYLYGVKATATCKTGAKGLYVPAGIVEHDGECEFNTQVAETYTDWGTGSITDIDAE